MSLDVVEGKPIRTLISEAQLQTRIAELGAQITQDYAASHHFVVIGVLRGCFLFLSDLVRHIRLPLVVDFLGLSSYGGRTATSGVVRVTSDLSIPILGCDVLVVEDIIDTGLTMNYLLENLRTRQPHSIKICSLLEKPARLVQPVQIDYLGFTIPNQFVIGYGLDYQDRYRNLPYIGVVDGGLHE